MKDTALPTVFLKRGVSHRASKLRREAFERTCRGVLDALYNHPSVIYYTIFNEGWGQFSAKEFYHKLKALDPSRVYDTTSGWFKVRESDVESETNGLLTYDRRVLKVSPARMKALADKLYDRFNERTRK